MSAIGLEQIPQRLVVNRVVELHLAAFDDGAQFTRATVGGGLFQLGIAALHVGTENLGNPLRGLEILDRLVNVVGQIASAFTQVLDLGDFAIDRRS